MTGRKLLCTAGVAWPCNSEMKGEAGGQGLDGCLVVHLVLSYASPENVAT